MSNTDAPTTKRDALPWGLRVRELRVRTGMKQDDLADKIGTTKGTISKIERSTGRPKFEWIEKLAKALDVDIGMLALDEATSIRRPDRVPVIGMISAGQWREAVQSTDEYISVIDAKPHMFALRVHGDSIDRIAPDGAFISIDPTDPTLHDGSMYAVQNAEGDATVKRFRRSPDRLEPDSTNPKHKPILLGSDPITIIGRATSVIQML